MATGCVWPMYGILLLLSLLFASSHGLERLVVCDAPIYCNDQVLNLIQFAGIFNDSKTFVDMPMKASPDDVLRAFHELPAQPSKFDILLFLDQYFSYPGSDIQVWTPEDWQARPPDLSRLVDPTLREWAFQLNEIWRDLGRKTAPEVLATPERHSLVPLRFGYIVPGGRFREFYYWDTFWIINGLLACDMFSTVEGTLDNFVTMVDEFGFIPNGARVYYSQRSQPPMFTQMVWSYYQTVIERNLTTSVGDGRALLAKYIDTLDREYRFWMEQRALNVTVDGTTYVLNHYKAHSNLPRPEGYTEDIETAEAAGVKEPYEPHIIYQDIASGAESGWDFTSRWFGDYQRMDTIATSQILPVDLNAILYKNEITLHRMHSILANSSDANPIHAQQAHAYLAAAQRRKDAFENVFWNQESGYWVDYDLATQSPRSTLPELFYSSSFTPLWAGLYWDDLTTGKYSAQEIGDRFLAAIEEIGVANFVGGLPAAMKQTTQQWDFPNGWAPLQMFAVHGMAHLGSAGKRMAAQLASAWLQSNYNGWLAAHQMFEKYSVISTSGLPGEGGEYNVQSGFGWTNGAIFELLLQYCTEVSCINSEGLIDLPSHPSDPHHDSFFPWDWELWGFPSNFLYQ